MASETQTITAPVIIKGPARIDLLEAMFFDRKKMLTFDVDRRLEEFDGHYQVHTTLLGIVPTSVEQSKVLILDYYKNHAEAQQGKKRRLVIVYDDHSRTGWFTWSNTITEMLNEPWYSNEDERCHPGKPVTTIAVARIPETPGGEFRAHIEKRPDLSALGTTPHEAIGKLIRAHRERFDLKEEPGVVDNTEINDNDLGAVIRATGVKLGIKVRNLLPQAD